MMKPIITKATGMSTLEYAKAVLFSPIGITKINRRLDDTIDVPFAMGHGGQRIAILSNANAVMVTQAEPNPKPPSSSYKRHKAIDSLLFEDFAYFLMKPLPDITRIGALTRSALLRGLYIENRAYIPNKGNALRLMDDL